MVPGNNFHNGNKLISSYMLMLAALLLFSKSLFAICTPSGANLQAALDTGNDLVLCKGEVYEIGADSLIIIVPGQAIYTEDATKISEYATLMSTDTNQLAILNGEGKSGVRLEHLIFDGNRYRIGSRAFFIDKSSFSCYNR